MKNKHIIGGIHSVTTVLQQQSETVLEVWVHGKRQDRRLQSIIDKARAASIAVKTVNRQTLSQHSPQHQGVLAWCASPASLSLHDSLEKAVQGNPLMLVLDGVTDPHNLGSCLRSAAAAGVSMVIAPKDRAASLNPVVHKVSCGASTLLPFFAVTNMARSLRQLKEHGIWLYGGVCETQAASLYQQDLTGPIAFVLGSEGKGLRRLTREHCDHLFTIPVEPHLPSLNIAVATGVCLFEARRQRTH